MNRKSIGFILLLFGLVMIIGGALLGIGKIKGVASGFSSIATFASPGQVEVTIEEADTYSLWHDHRTMHERTTVNNPPALPSGFSFKMRNTSSGIEIPLDHSSSNSTLTTGSREATGVGSFAIPSAGTYQLEGSNPAGDVRVFSISKGTLLSQFGNIGGVVLYGIVGFIGLILAIPGVLLLFLAGKKSQMPPPVR